MFIKTLQFHGFHSNTIFIFSLFRNNKILKYINNIVLEVNHMIYEQFDFTLKIKYLVL